MGAGRAISPDFKADLHRAVCHGSKFHQLLRVACYWNASTQMYIEPASGEPLPQAMEEETRRLHIEIFGEWLTMRRAEQRTEFTAYAGPLACVDRELLVRLLRSPAGREALIPPDASYEARSSFAAGLGRLLKLSVGCIQDECGDD